MVKPRGGHVPDMLIQRDAYQSTQPQHRGQKNRSDSPSELTNERRHQSVSGAGPSQVSTNN